MHGVYKIYSSWVAAIKLGRQAASWKLRSAPQGTSELGLQSSWASIKLRQAGSTDELHRQSSWAATHLRSCAMR